MMCDAVEEWGLIRLVNHGISTEWLNMKEIEKTKHSMLMGTKRVHLNYYPKYLQLELAIGIGRHSDSSTVTILHLIGGFWGRKSESDPWIHVALINGALVINVGDALEIMSNGRYKNFEYFVTVSKSHNRISVLFFTSPTPCAIIRPFEEVLESTGE
ncbi:feruloyl CoA ortho-hydroxylase 2-like [Coffea eugenioides]|uniref:feruloyl CoA ortho-hydroxylase 2-like n=1 Tax=Coffea eugenioides TaxID=49369 RepID=UPI000F60C961|nr:feruloyl CoA ortho-hydroxylase 2-like [Coffea eugenioides]